MADDNSGLAREGDPDTSHEAAGQAKARAREIAQQSLKVGYPMELTARGLADLAQILYPNEVRDAPGFITTETIRRRWHEFPDARKSPDGAPWGELVYQTHSDGTPVLDHDGFPVPARGMNPLGNTGRLMRWRPR